MISKIILFLTLFFSIYSVPALSGNLVIGAGTELLFNGELSGSYDYVSDFGLSYNFGTSKTFQYLIESGFSNSHETGSQYTQIRAGGGLRYLYGSLGSFDFFLDLTLGLAYTRETFYISLFDRQIETDFNDTGINTKLTTGFFFKDSYGLSLSIRQYDDQSTSAGLRLLYRF